MGKVIVVTSGKGGVGKTTTSANVGMALAKNGKKVMLIDADTGLRNLDIALGLCDSVVFDASDIMNRKCRLEKAVIKSKSYEGLSFIAASQTKKKKDITEEQMQMLCAELSERYDFVIIDCPAGIDGGFRTAVLAAEKAIVVVTPDLASVRDADRVLGKLDEYGLSDSKIVINRLRADMIKKGEMISIEEIIEMLAADILGAVPEDEGVLRSAGIGASLSEKSRAARCYSNIARRLCGEEVPLEKVQGKMTFKRRIMEKKRRKQAKNKM